MAREFRPRKIVLFGSYAYGRPTPDSDVDLLVILPFHGSAAVVPRYPGGARTKAQARRALKACQRFRKEARRALGLPAK